jgi:serine/threonine-protein kinase HipA
MKLAVIYQGESVGELCTGADGLPVFTYALSFIRRGLELSPLNLPLAEVPYVIRNPALRNLPGLIYDCLPDAYGIMALRERLLRANLGDAGRGPLALLSLVGNNAIGALEFRPMVEDSRSEQFLSITQALVEAKRFGDAVDRSKIGRAFLQSAGNAGGQHPKATGYWDAQTEKLHLGTSAASDAWLPVIVKLDLENAAPVNVVEHIYMRMAEASGIEIANTWLLRNPQGAHLIAQRFDRTPLGAKLHQHSFAGMAHLDFHQRGHRYEQLLTTVLRVCSSRSELIEAYRRAVFNVLAHNHDDHAKNISFTMSEDGRFRLTPAYDLVFTETEDGAGHWMTVNGQSEYIGRSDLVRMGEKFNFKPREIAAILGEVSEGVAAFERFAKEARLGPGWTLKIKQHLAVIRERMRT